MLPFYLITLPCYHAMVMDQRLIYKFLCRSLVGMLLRGNANVCSVVLGIPILSKIERI